MQKAFLYLYNIWCIFWLIFIFLVLFPFMFVTLQQKKWFSITHYLIRLWGQLFFFMAAIRIKVIHEFVPDTQGTYVIVANHFSYLDVACMGVVLNNYYAFFGKSTVKKIPLLGYVFAKLYIQVDRSDKWSRSKSIIRGLDALDARRSICVFPEGGILSEHIPQMKLPFKDGAFLMAIEKQVPILPISFLNNYQLMPQTLLKSGTLQAIIHQPIFTTGKTKEDIDFLKNEVYTTIQNAINSFNK